MNTTQANIDAVEKTDKDARQGFFLASVSVLERIAQKAGPKEMAAYLVLCGGVNGYQPGRFCTHGAKSVDTRTGMSRRESTDAIQWLSDEGIIRPPHPQEPQWIGTMLTRANQVTWVICDDEELDVAISQSFLAPTGNSRRSQLQRLLQDIRCTPEISTPMAQSDAILLFMGLLRDQDYGAWNGVRPTLLHQLYAPAPVKEHGGDLCAAIPGTDRVVIAVEPSGPWHFDPSLCAELFRGQSGISPTSRLTHGLKELLRLRMVHDVLTLWEGDPRTRDGLRRSAPYATLDILTPWARELDISLSAEVTRIVSATLDDRDDGQPEKRASGEGGQQHRHHFVCRHSARQRIKVVRQVRVHYWAETDSAVDGFCRMRDRTLSAIENLEPVADFAAAHSGKSDFPKPTASKASEEICELQ